MTFDDAASLTLTHEHFHWTQSQGTSIGQFSRLLQYWSILTVLSMRRDLLDLQWSRIGETRKSRSALVPINPRSLEIYYDRLPDFGSEFGMLRLTWYDALLLERMLTFPARFVDVRDVNPTAALTRSLRLLSMLLSPDPDAIAEFIQSAGSKADRAIRNPVPPILSEISTESIMELAACIQEAFLLQQLDHEDGDRTALLAIHKEVLGFSEGGSERGRASHLAWVAIEALIPIFGVRRTLIAIAVACDVALNPPLPPTDWGNHCSLDFGQVVPGLRFSDALFALSKVTDVPEAEPSNDQLREFAVQVSLLAGLSLSSVYETGGRPSLGHTAHCSGALLRHFREQDEFAVAPERHRIRVVPGLLSSAERLWIPDIPVTCFGADEPRFARDIQGLSNDNQACFEFLVTTIEDACLGLDFLSSRWWPTLSRLPQTEMFRDAVSQVRTRLGSFVDLDRMWLAEP